MALRTGHGSGTGSPRVEVLPADEQPRGVPAPSIDPTALQAEPPVRHSGRIADRQRAAELGRKGGLARAAKAIQLRALTSLGLRGATPEILAPYLDDAFEFASSEVDREARECGGGVCPQNAAALVHQAALAMAGSRAAYATGDTALGAKLGIEVRQNLLAARELTVREAQSRPKVPQAYPWLTAAPAKPEAPTPTERPLPEPVRAPRDLVVSESTTAAEPEPEVEP